MLSDADLERAANFATYYSMQNAGQTCISIERVYVEEPVYDEFVAKSRRRCARCASRASWAELGPRSVRSHSPQMQTIREPRRRRGSEGRPRARRAAELTSGSGRFYEPTVLVDVDHTMKIMTEETFGPTLPIMKVADSEEAVRLANDSPTGSAPRCSARTSLASAGSPAASRRAPSHVNDAMINYTVLELPMGGAKASGLGSRHGPGGIRKCTPTQALVVTPRFALKRDTAHVSPTRPDHQGSSACVFKFLYGRGKRD